MAQETINVGATPNDGSGDPLRTAFEKCNNNFTELYSTSYTPARISNGASSVNIPTSDGNIEITVNDIANTVLITQTGTYVTGLMSATGNVTSSNLSTSGLMSATGNVTGGNILTGGLVSATGNISGANVNAGANVYATTHTGTTASLSGNVQAGNLRTVGQVSATGNVTGQFIIGDGGFLSNVTVVSNVSVSQISNGTSVIAVTGSGANATVTIGGTANIAVFANTGTYVTGLISATGNVRGGNIVTAGLCQATGNVTGGNIVTAGIVSSAGNVYGGNLVTASGFVLASGNVTGGNLITTGLVSTGSVTSTGNVDSGNLRTAGVVSATGNITGSYIIGDGSQLTNINTAQISNGTSNVRVTSSGGNIGISVGGSANVAVYATTGEYVTGVISATGNITGANLLVTNISGILTTASQTNITSVGTLSSLSVTADVQAGNLRTAGLVSATGTITGANITGGNILTSGIVSSTGNITAGNLTVGTGTINVGQIRNTNANGVGNIGAVGGYFNTVFALATSAQYADLAEYYTTDYDYEPGTVVKFGGDQEITLSDKDADPEVAGIISTSPAYVMNASIQGEYTAAVALQGRVPCKVQGPVRKGQMMVSAGNGYARAEQKPEIGTVIGKALENFSGNQGTIEVVVGRV